MFGCSLRTMLDGLFSLQDSQYVWQSLTLFSLCKRRNGSSKEKHEPKHITNANMKTNRSRVARQRRKYLLEMLRGHSANVSVVNASHIFCKCFSEIQLKSYCNLQSKRYLFNKWKGCAKKYGRKNVAEKPYLGASYALPVYHEKVLFKQCLFIMRKVLLTQCS